MEPYKLPNNNIHISKTSNKFTALSFNQFAKSKSVNMLWHDVKLVVYTKKENIISIKIAKTFKGI